MTLDVHYCLPLLLLAQVHTYDYYIDNPTQPENSYYHESKKSSFQETDCFAQAIPDQ